MTAVPAADTSITNRMLRAAKLDADVYEEVEHDQGATTQAAIVVVVTSIAAGIGGLASGEWLSLVVLPIVALLGWVLYAAITYFIGTRLLAGPNTSATWGELARTLGFAASPRILLVAGFIPILGGILFFVVAIWTLITTVIAVRAALDFETWRAIVTAVLGWLVQAIAIGGAVALLS